MDEREQLAFWSGHLAIHGICKLILSSAPLQGRKRPANRETLAHCLETRFPWRVGIGDAVAWRNGVPLLSLVLYGLKQRDPVHVTRRAHSAALPCCDELWTGRRALWIG